MISFGRLRLNKYNVLQLATVISAIDFLYCTKANKNKITPTIAQSIILWIMYGNYQTLEIKMDDDIMCSLSIGKNQNKNHTKIK